MESYYSISLKVTQLAPEKMFRQIEKGELFLSPHGLLAGFNKMACLDSRELAKKFLDAYMPKLRKRYGADVVVSVDVWKQKKLSRHEIARIKRDSDLARKRLETGILAANQSPVSTVNSEG
ncbi:hypothetical protein FY034_18815 (plasmid) [Trichlorobacter lovleyi]|uniref:hypothetical protein n=1 Tax=Trichlorobacter lovleyi TaxID=313985 RepID=UPI00223F3BDD|nr:hypothetical protein [Trichlorobacter lovleyi]QOX81030.1 hypothetical protein FY034_18815 [Trichlorobacter lovleyi]